MDYDLCYWVVMDKLALKPTRHQFALVNMSKIEEAKAQSATDGEVDFVSINDVITSWYFNQICCHTTKMVINSGGIL